MQYRDNNFGGMQYRDNNFNQIPILSTKRTTLQMAADSKFADFGINIGRIFNLSTYLKLA